MTQRSMLQELSVSSGIKFETLRTRWKNGYRGSALLEPTGTRMGKRRQKVEHVKRPASPAIRARAPEFFFEDKQFWTMQ